MKPLFNKDLNTSAKFKKALLILLAALFLILLCFSFASASYPALAASAYSDVLDDLETDESFNPDDYPENDSDYSLQVIQIAEGEDGDLFIYVYQLYQGTVYDLTATKITLSQTFYADSSYAALTDSFTAYNVYDLTLVNHEGVFYKYKVEDIELKSTVIRYYSITAIHRKYYPAIDTDTSSGTASSTVALAVGQTWEVQTYNGEVYYYLTNSEVVTITDKLVSYVRVAIEDVGVIETGYTGVDYQFIAFNCDFPIDQIYEADVYYESHTRTKDYFSDDITDGETVSQVVTLKADEAFETTPGLTGGMSYLFGRKTYSCQQIQTADNFIKQIESYDNAYADNTDDYYADFEAAVSGYSYVLTFAMTDYEVTMPVGWVDMGLVELIISLISGGAGSYTMVDEAAILRLMYEYEGQVYNVGVVDNLTGSTKDPATSILDTSSVSSATSTFLIILVVIIVIVIIVLLCIFCPQVFPYIFKAIWWVISAPFRFIRWVYRKIKERRDDKNKEKAENKKNSNDDSSNSVIVNVYGDNKTEKKDND